ncbi:MAG: hypothetical protein JWN76_2442 [Chitinophagaceae bacterium]|nr:hypothetical protein [Chitinophagaceae bacterium]
MGTLVKLHSFFTDRASLFDLPILAEFRTLNSKLDTHMALLMYQLSMEFIYYHELAHLIQYSPLDDDCLTEHVIEVEKTDEVYAVSAGKDDPYDLIKHVKEFDADLHGGYFICLHLIQYWKKLDESDRSQANLELLISLGTGAIFSYFILLLQKYPEMYYDASDHPHPLIRILYIIDMFIQTAEKNQPQGMSIKPEAILNRAFRLTEAMFTFAGGENVVKNFADIFMGEKENIELYVNNVLIPESLKLPYLVLQRVAANNVVK